MPPRRRLLPLAILLSMIGSGHLAVAEDLPVDLELVLAVDVSGSIDAEEAALQRQGYLAAIVHREVLQAITGGTFGRIALAYMEWAGEHHQSIIVDWSMIDGSASASAFATALAAKEPRSERWTSISAAIDSAAALFADNGFEGTRKVIDISGDGPNNSGRAPDEARDLAVAQGITINGLPILNGRPGPGGWPGAVDLDSYYRDHVIGGAGAFLVPAENFDSFAGAIRAKLVREIATPQPPEPSPTRAINSSSEQPAETPATPG